MLSSPSKLFRMNSLRLLVATALCAWLVLPSQSLAQCSGSFELTVTLLTDNYPGETTWSLTDDAGSVLLQGGPYNQVATTYTESICADPGCYTFTINDSFGDGICCFYGPGSYSVLVDGTEVASGGNFGVQDTENFCLEFLCTDETACNYNPDAEEINPLEENCLYPEDLYGPGYDCDGQCIVDADADGICDEVDPCVGEFDACGVCNGPGEIYECGCYDADALGVCDGNCAVDADADGICDECIPPPGYWLDIEEVMVHSEGELDGMVTYRVSLACSSEADFLEAISGGGTGALEIASTSGTWYNHPANPSWNPSGLVADSIALYPNLAFDSFLTIGADDADSGPFPVDLGWTVEDPRVEFEPGGGNNLLIDEGNGSCYFSYPGLAAIETHPGFAGDELRVLLLQITTAGEISGQFVLRIRPAGQNAFTQTLLFDSEAYCLNLDDCIDTDGDAICDDEDDCVDVDQDQICDDVDDCVGDFDSCGVCNGPGAIYECGCNDIPEEDCDCDGNQLDALGVCGGECAEDADADGICDDVDDCVGELDACGVCNGDGAVYECGCNDIPEGDCDCNGNQLDALGDCGGDCVEDLDEDGICDVDDDCVGELDAIGVCNGSCVADTNNNGICDAEEQLGCTDEMACNFDPNAITDNGTCEYPEALLDCEGNCLNDADNDGVCDELEVLGCDNVEACNYDELATDDDGSCLIVGTPCDDGDSMTLNDMISDSCVCVGDSAIFGCTDMLACNFMVEANVEDNSCTYPQEFLDCNGDCLNDVNENLICDEEEVGCTDPLACNFDVIASTDDGSCEYPEQYYNCDGDCINDVNDNDICDEFDLEGCMQDFSCNFNPEATIPDTSCIYPGDDCDDNDPETVNDEVMEDCGCAGEIPEPDGIDALTQWGIEMYPSPVQDVLRIQFRGEAHGATTFTMTSMSGQTVRSRTLQSDATVDVSDLASGVYFATFEGTWGKATRRVMVASGR